MTDTNQTPNNRMLLRKMAREVASRKQAEQLLEQKSLELFETNQKLELAIAQLEKTSAQNLIKLEFQQKIDALLIHFGRVFLSKNLDDIILDNFTQTLTQNNLIVASRLEIDTKLELGLSQQFYGHDDFPSDQPTKLTWQNAILFVPLTIREERLGCLKFKVELDTLEPCFVERSIQLVAELLCGALNRQHVIYRNIESRKVAEKSERSTRDFLAMINHELRTPLNGLLGSSELLQDTQLDSEQNLLVSNIAQSGEFLRAIINNLLDYSKINSGMFELIPSHFQLTTLLKTLESIFEYKANEKALTLHFTNRANKALMLKGDLERLTQIFVNLIGNAIKFTHQGSVTITLDWDQDHLNFEVADTGIGISKEAQAKLFQPFTQADRSSARHYEGTGLGLAICHQLITLMGGNITLSSQLDVGTRFYGKIPLPEVLRTQCEKAKSGKQDIDKTLSPNLSILVVDDIKMNQIIIKEMLSKIGIMPAITSNGVEALQACEDKSYDVIFMDCRMPEMDGFEATESLRAKQYIKPIIALTAGTTLSERERCIESGMDDILTKPYTTDDLKSMLLKWID